MDLLAALATADGFVVADARRSSVRQRRVSAELRRLRQDKNMTCDDIARALGCSVSKISRMETGVRGLNVDDVSAILGLLRVPAKQREELLALVRDGEQRNWVQIGGKLPEPMRKLINFENEAAALFNYESMLVPGLLQTGDYARTVIRASNPMISDAEVHQMVVTRMSRQAVLSRFRAPMFSVIIDEMALRRPLGEPGVMQGQLRHLSTMAGRPRVDLRVVPFETRDHPGLGGPLMILEFDDQPTLVQLDARGTSGVLEEESVIRGARLTWRRLLDVALAPDESARLVATVAGEMT